jgi:hypothetical protein
MKFEVGDKVRLKKTIASCDGDVPNGTICMLIATSDLISQIIDPIGRKWTIATNSIEPVYATGGVVSIHDLPTSEWYNPVRLDLPEFVFDAEQAKELAERLNKKLAGHFNAFSNNDISPNTDSNKPIKDEFY